MFPCAPLRLPSAPEEEPLCWLVLVVAGRAHLPPLARRERSGQVDGGEGRAFN